LTKVCLHGIKSGSAIKFTSGSARNYSTESPDSKSLYTASPLLGVSILLPTLAGDKFAAAGMGFAPDGCRSEQDGQEGEDEEIFHGQSLIQVARAASLRQISLAMNAKSKFLRGQLLLDAGELGGSFFARTVVLICQHDAEGAFGLVLNHATEKKFSEVVQASLPEQLKDAPLFLGGPVQPSAMSYLHSEAFLPDANVMTGLSLGHSLDTLIELGEGYSPTRKLKTFAGYSGWAPGQLESEMKRDAWITHPATLDLIFDPQPESLWKKILRRKGWKYEILAESPDDPSLN